MDLYDEKNQSGTVGQPVAGSDDLAKVRKTKQKKGAATIPTDVWGAPEVRELAASPYMAALERLLGYPLNMALYSEFDTPTPTQWKRVLKELSPEGTALLDCLAAANDPSTRKQKTALQAARQYDAIAHVKAFLAAYRHTDKSIRNTALYLLVENENHVDLTQIFQRDFESYSIGQKVYVLLTMFAYVRQGSALDRGTFFEIASLAAQDKAMQVRSICGQCIDTYARYRLYQAGELTAIEQNHITRITIMFMKENESMALNLLGAIDDFIANADVSSGQPKVYTRKREKPKAQNWFAK